MARQASKDLFHSFRFWASVLDPNQTDLIAVPNRPDAGFSAVTTPEYSLEAVEYREGHNVFTQKYPGIISTSDLTLSRGVVLRDTGFYDWLLNAGAGGGEYRATVTIYHFHRTGLPDWQAGTSVPGPDLFTAGQAAAVEPHRQYIVENALPTRVKPAGDLEGTASDVSIAEADVAYEYFTIKDVG